MKNSPDLLQEICILFSKVETSLMEIGLVLWDKDSSFGADVNNIRDCKEK